MKIRHLLLAAVLVAAAAACSAEVTEPSARAPAGARPGANEVTSTASPDSTQREEAGWLGSGGGE